MVLTESKTTWLIIVEPCNKSFPQQDTWLIHPSFSSLMGATGQVPIAVLNVLLPRPTCWLTSHV